MKTPIVSITLGELQDALNDALNDYCRKYASSQPECVHVTSNGEILLRIELRPKGLVKSEAFKHRSEA